MRLAAVSVDLDEIPNYFAIHGLPAPSGRTATRVYDLGLGRLARWAEGEGIPLTLFAIGSDLARPNAGEALRDLVGRGHEVANHSHDHLYDLTRRPRAVMREQVERAAAAIARATGVPPTGFRAPGYTVNDTLLDVLRELGVAYDSSVFPCPPYWLLKATKLGLIRLARRRSRSVLDTPRVLTAPSEPYRLGSPYWRRGAGLVELPIQVTRGPRLPYIGTTLTLAGPTAARWLTRGVLGSPLVNLELHGIDVLDDRDDLADLRPHQTDVRVPHEQKLAALSAAVGELRRAGYSFVRLDQAAAQVSRGGHAPAA